MSKTLNLEGHAPSVFNNPEFGSVRVIMREDGEPLFCLKDVASCLGYANPNEAITNRCDPDSVSELLTETSKGPREAKFGPESEVYRLIFGSKLESAKKFQDWVFKDVLPSIRKTGSYSVAQPSYQIEDPIARAQKWIEEEKVRIELQDKNDEQRHVIKQQSDVIDVLLPKAIAFDDETSTGGWYSGSEAAKLIYGRAFKDGRTKLYEFLREKGVLLRVGKNNMPSGHYMDNGWLKTVWTSDERTGHEVPTPVFSKKGIKGIHGMLIEEELETYKEPLFVGSI